MQFQYKYMKFVSLLIGVLILGLEIYIYKGSETCPNSLLKEVKIIDGIMMIMTIVSILESGFSIVFFEDFKRCWQFSFHLVLGIWFFQCGIFIFGSSLDIVKTCKEILELHLGGTICGYLRVRFGCGVLSLLNFVVYLVAATSGPESQRAPATLPFVSVTPSPFQTPRRLSTATISASPTLPNEPPPYSEHNPLCYSYELPPPYSSVDPIPDTISSK